MGEAKRRGSLELRIEQAKQYANSLRPEKIKCNHCGADISSFDTLDTRGMNGVEAAYKAFCTCGHSTIAMRGDSEAVARAMAMYQESVDTETLIGWQPITK